MGFHARVRLIPVFDVLQFILINFFNLFSMMRKKRPFSSYNFAADLFNSIQFNAIFEISLGLFKLSWTTNCFERQRSKPQIGIFSLLPVG